VAWRAQPSKPFVEFGLIHVAARVKSASGGVAMRSTGRVSASLVHMKSVRVCQFGVGVAHEERMQAGCRQARRDLEIFEGHRHRQAIGVEPIALPRAITKRPAALSPSRACS